MDIMQKDLAKFYNITTQTLYNYRKSNDSRLNNRYKALEEFYKKKKRIRVSK